jgi:L,D-transpeptidase YcbB
LSASIRRHWAATTFSFALLICAEHAFSSQPIVASVVERRASINIQHHLAETTEAIRASVSRPTLLKPTTEERTELVAVYEAGGYAPLWVDAMRRPSRAADEALGLLGGARDEGLDPADYGSHELERFAARLKVAVTRQARDVAIFDVGLSSALLRYLRHLHTGRLDPRTVGFRLKTPTDRHDYAALLRFALDEDGIIETAAQLKPAIAQYEALRLALARYRSLAAGGAFDEPFPPIVKVVRQGEPYAGLNSLHRRLIALGDLPADTESLASTALYDGSLVAGVRRFQVRHGLRDDGILGEATKAALDVPLRRRVTQIELALERLRWLPHLGDRSIVAINIPMFRLWAWDLMPQDDTPSLGMRVIVGRALKTQTPVFDAELREVIFRPYWNVPRSILRNEILPILRRDTGYLDRQDMELVGGPGDNASPVEITDETLALLRRGKLRLRQRPGPQNALGLVKFVFPNEADVYMHGTPAQQLFNQNRRDFSHGCVRVEDPVSLAEWVLKENPGWSRDQILSAMAGTQSIRVNLARPIQVILFYTTAVVMPEDGTVRFAEDIYRHDARLDQALARHSLR